MPDSPGSADNVAMTLRGALALALLAIFVSGCGSHDRADRPIGDKDHTIVELSHPELPKVLPDNVCFAGFYSYDVMLLGDQVDAATCARLARDLFPEEKPLPWSPKQLEDPDQVVECEFSLMESRLFVWRGDPDMEGPRFDRAYDLADGACSKLRRSGWTPVDPENF
jgi:hypothetical protein